MKKGYTLIEIIVAISILALVFAIILANYQRGGSDSVLSRETNLLMSRIRFAQEESSSGKTFNYCYHLTGTVCKDNSSPMVCSNDPYHTCTTDADCSAGGICRFACDPQGNGGNNCCPGGTDRSGVCPTGNETPSGGFALSFACPGGFSDPYADHDYPYLVNGASMYGLFAERRTCGGFLVPSGCFPPILDAFNDSTIGSDGIVSAMTLSWLGGQLGQTGDTLQERYLINPQVVVKDLQLVAKNAISGFSNPTSRQTFSCNTGGTPWRSMLVPTAGNSKVPGTYPLQVAVRFLPPDGRIVMLTDNIAMYPPTAWTNNGTPQPDQNNPWVSASVMLGLKNRLTDCRVVTVTRAGLISQSVDADCNFAT